MRTISSLLSMVVAGARSIPSAGMQYVHRRLQRSVSEMRRYVWWRPNVSVSMCGCGAPSGRACSSSRHDVDARSSGLGSAASLRALNDASSARAERCVASRAPLISARRRANASVVDTASVL